MRRVNDIFIDADVRLERRSQRREHRRPLLTNGAKRNTEARKAERRQNRTWRLPLITRRMRIAAKAAAMIALIAGPTSWLVLTPIGQNLFESGKSFAMQASADWGYRVQDVFVEGRLRADKVDLLAALDVKRGYPIFALDIDAARKRLEALSWVESASLERRLPGEIHVSIKERQPVALWQNKGRYYLVDGGGLIVGDEDDAKLFLAENTLPLIVGEGAPDKTTQLFALLNNQPEIRARIKAAQWISGRRWNLKLDDAEAGITIRLPEEDPEGALAELTRIDIDQGVLSRKVTLIDLRLSDRIVLRTEPRLRPDRNDVAAPEKPRSGRNA